jgi:hypothetical protein
MRCSTSANRGAQASGFATHQRRIEHHEFGTDPGGLEQLCRAPILQLAVICGVARHRSNHCHRDIPSGFLKCPDTDPRLPDVFGGREVGERKGQQDHITFPVPHNGLATSHRSHCAAYPGPGQNRWTQGLPLLHPAARALGRPSGSTTGTQQTPGLSRPVRPVNHTH